MIDKKYRFAEVGVGKKPKVFFLIAFAGILCLLLYLMRAL